MSDYNGWAKTAASNNLVLSVINDGAIYQDRLHCGFAMLQGATHRMTFKDIVNAEATRQRKEFGSKFKLSDIADAASIIEKDTIQDCVELIRDAWNGETIICTGRRWWDKANGNSYFSACIEVPTDNGFKRFNIPFQYGYGDQWRFECRHVLQRIGFDGMVDGYESEKPLYFTDCGYCLKRNQFQGVYL